MKYLNFGRPFRNYEVQIVTNALKKQGFSIREHTSHSYDIISDSNGVRGLVPADGELDLSTGCIVQFTQIDDFMSRRFFEVHDSVKKDINYFDTWNYETLEALGFDSDGELEIDSETSKTLTDMGY